MYRLWSTLVLVIAFSNFAASDECPKNWVDYKTSCYRFSRSPRKTVVDAEEICRKYGSTLVSVNSVDEHFFIISWLKENDPQHLKWLTSGNEQANNIWKWQGDKTNFPNIPNLWLTYDYRINTFLKFAAYNFSLYENRWGLIRVSNVEEGAYICEIQKFELQLSLIHERNIDYGVTVTDRTKVPRGPKFIEEPTPLVFDMSGRSQQNNAILRCTASGWPTPTYSWYKEEYEGSKTKAKLMDPLEDIRITQTDGTLIIYNPSQSDKGKYFCKATNEFGSIISETVQLSFGFIGEFSKVRSVEYGNANWGKSISCDPPLFHPRVHYYWNKNALFSFVEQDRRVFASNDGNLYFSSLEVIDRANYSCNVQSVISSTGRTGPFFRLVVEPAPNNQKLLFPNNFPKSFPKAPLAGEQVLLECVAYGYPVPTYNWTRSGVTNKLPDGAYTTSHNRILVIPKVKVEDSGDYSCSATSGRDVITKSITLSIQSLPVFTVPLTDQVMDLRTTLVWNCEAFGIPEVSYSWYKNGRELTFAEMPPQEQPRYKVKENILTIEDLSDVDNGMYQCKAYNQLGSKFTSAQLKVMALRPIFKKYVISPEMYASVGSNYTIPCIPEAVPFPTFQWRRNGAPITAIGGRVRIQPNGYLYINPVDKADEGEYRCIAINEFGQDETVGFLTVFEKPHIVDFLAPKIVANVNDSVELNCEAHTDNSLDIAYIWLHNNLRVNYTTMPQFQPGTRYGYLRINNITLAEAGFYTCIVKTAVGRTSTYTELIVNGPPSSPGAVLAEDLTATSATIKWSDGSENGRMILAYLIEGRTNHNSTWLVLANYVTRVQVDSLTNRRKAQIKDVLSPWSTYEFRVSAINELGVSMPSSPSPQYNTDKSHPFKAPSNVGGGGGKAGTLTVTWDPLPPQDWNAPKIWYRVYYKQKGSTAEYFKVDIKKLGNVGLYTIAIDESDYYKKYLVKVQAVNPIGEGPISEPAVVYSAESMPQIQPSLVRAVAFNSTAINVTWAPVDATREKLRGKLIGHRIKYWINGRDAQTDALTLLSRNVAPWGIIVALKPDTEYYISVMAYNDAGSGPESEPFLVKTYKSAPRNAPTSVAVSWIDKTTIRVTWRGITEVSNAEEPIIGYKVRYWEEEQPLTAAKEVYKYLDGGDLEAIISGLTPGTSYMLRVLGYSLGGDGKMSSPPKKFVIK
ncbi:contactin-like protein [Leptotrombidium deliense]|uniref:Contactin-like protein n=1 Tax=Leptotrombidium deliense TaxID=299467 RepID=A0A443SMF6_9ACAR|nr:contactin-like protein [Leptotrombidium deliense]